tara:strand:+ start:774 stop:998 length:225 start_codon:yes stop_codon:yes gene_type:complete
MWRIVEDINKITGKSVWVIEKKTGWPIKKWSRDYPVGNSKMNSPIKSLSKNIALERMNTLSNGEVLVKGEIIEL